MTSVVRWYRAYKVAELVRQRAIIGLTAHFEVPDGGSGEGLLTRNYGVLASYLDFCVAE